MTDDWSAQIASRFDCQLSAELTEWFDAEIWKHQGLAEFCQPIKPIELLDEAPDAIRPGMMRCDLLPLISNRIGDWLCVRIDERNLAAEVIHWYHGGGDWIPWGRGVSEALAFDAVVDRFPSYQRRHAEPAESLRSEAGSSRPSNDRLLAWALENLPREVRLAIELERDSAVLSAALLNHRIAEVAVRCEQAISIVLSGDPDWDLASKVVSAAARVTPELAWPWEIAGFAAEQRDEIDSALAAYARGARCSAFTDQSVRLTTHAVTKEAAKFSLVRLLELAPDAVHSDPYLTLLCGDQLPCRQAVMQYWLDRAHQQSANAPAAYDCFVAAGWDLGAPSLESYVKILEQAATAAAAAGQLGRAAVARTHRKCLSRKFGV